MGAESPLSFRALLVGAVLPVVFLLQGVATFLAMPYTVLMPAVAKDMLHGGPRLLGWLMGGSGIGATLGALRLASQRDPEGDAGSAMGRNELGRTSAEMAALTGDWSDSRWGLNPGPIESIAMMIWDARAGGGLVVWVVSVLCGAGGGLTVHPPSSTVVAGISTP